MMPSLSARLPSLETWPHRIHLRPAAFDNVIPVVLRAGRAGMVRQDTQECADGEIGRLLRVAGAVRDHAVLLVGIDHDDVFQDLAVQIADYNVALVHELLSGV